MTVYLTSDLHFGHAKVAAIRGFGESIRAHDDAISTSLSGLTDRDDLWILGDISASKAGENIAFIRLGALPCKLHLICGNHDRCSAIHRDGWKHQREWLEVFDSIQEFARRRGPDRIPVMLSHYPYTGDHTEKDRFTQYRLRDEGSWLCHGHTHQPEIISGPRQIHVGWDAWHRPVSWEEITDCITDNM